MFWDGIKGLLIIVFAVFFGKMAFASEYIELPQDELAKETVLPLFDRPTVVKSRNVQTDGRIDASLFYGLALTEPIQNVSKLGVSAYYNWNEDHALGVLFSKNSTGTSSYAKQLENIKNPDNSVIQLDLSRAPKLESTLFLDYNVKAYYGKMSLTKNTVLNVALYGSAEIGLVKYEHKSYPALALGLGEKFYFNKNWALRFDMRMQINNAPIPFIKTSTSGSTVKSDPVPSFDKFDERLTYATHLEAGLNYLF